VRFNFGFFEGLIVKHKITQLEAYRYLRQWRALRQVQRRELRKTTFAEKFRQIGQLVAAAKSFPRQKVRNADLLAGRRNWLKLRKMTLHAK
jgi:hypothetical protein